MLLEALAPEGIVDGDLRDIYVDDIREFEFIGDSLRIVYTVTRRGEPAPVLSVVVPLRRVPGLMARAMMALQVVPYQPGH
jgi:hypothetical protein